MIDLIILIILCVTFWSMLGVMVFSIIAENQLNKPPAKRMSMRKALVIAASCGPITFFVTFIDSLNQPTKKDE